MEQEIQAKQEGSDVFFVLESGEVFSQSKELPKSFYVKGMYKNGKFLPQSGVLGIGDLAKEGRYGWLELNSNEFFPMESGKPAVTPFVKGYKNKDNKFIPSSREVFNSPL